MSNPLIPVDEQSAHKMLKQLGIRAPLTHGEEILLLRMLEGATSSAGPASLAGSIWLSLDDGQFNLQVASSAPADWLALTDAQAHLGKELLKVLQRVAANDIQEEKPEQRQR